MIERQHVWLGPEATTFTGACEACMAAQDSRAADLALVVGTLRAEADVGFVTCGRGHRIVVRRIGRPPRPRVLAAIRGL